MEKDTIMREQNMERIEVKRFALAWGITFALLYLGCVFVMATTGRERTIFFFNSLMHGLDVSSIIRMNMPFWKMLVGIIEIFILGWLTGATIAAIYNFRKEE
jgi:hypothetical protein